MAYTDSNEGGNEIERGLDASPSTSCPLSRRLSRRLSGDARPAEPAVKKVVVRRASQKVIDDVAATTRRLEEIGNHQDKKFEPILNPNSQIMYNYDLLVMIALIYTTLVTPYEVAILPTALNTRFFVNWFVDSIYIIDMLRSFITAYEDPVSNVLIKSNRLILKNYLKTWFLIDFVSIIPFDTLTLALGPAFAKVKAIKVIRLLRLLKLAKIFRSFALYDKYKAQFSIPLNVVSLLQVLKQTHKHKNTNKQLIT
jgi:hypothetical protein